MQNEEKQKKQKMSLTDKILVGGLIVFDLIAIIPQIILWLTAYSFDDHLSYVSQHMLFFSTTSHLTIVGITNMSIIIVILLGRKYGTYESIAETGKDRLEKWMKKLDAWEKQAANWEKKLERLGLTWEFFSPLIEKVEGWAANLSPEDKKLLQQAMVYGAEKGLEKALELCKSIEKEPPKPD